MLVKRKMDSDVASGNLICQSRKGKVTQGTPRQAGFAISLPVWVLV